MALDEIIYLDALQGLEEAEILVENIRQFYDYNNPFEASETKFIKMYRLSKQLVSDLIDTLTPYMEPPSRVSGLSIERKVLTALRFFASGSYQLDIGKSINHAVSQSSVSRSIKEVSGALNQDVIFNQYVKLPVNLEELQRTRRNFFLKHEFPGVLGCLDCTHVAIYPPQINHANYPEAIYVNRKGYHSINVQLICDSELKIMNVCARFPGSTHDSYIWNNSGALRYMQNLHRNGHTSFYLLGDSGYGVRPWLLTPIPEARPNSPEERYNERQRSTRSDIERCNGVLKCRFRCLLKHRVLHYTPQTASKIINACCILHNICIEHNLPPVELNEDRDNHVGEIDFGMYQINDRMQENRVNADLVAGRQIRERIVRNHFAI